MNREDEFPADIEEMIEFVQNVLKEMAENPDSVDLPVSKAELQRWLKKALQLKQTKEVERQARKEERAAWEKFCQQLQEAVEYGKKCGIDERQTRMLFSGKVKIANRIFSQLPDQGDTLYIQRKDKD